ncbi:helix-turn-helix domain-containing protein [Desulfovibrio sp. JC010]|uniref:helix-turn-helix domain-containing protein n=1 Tax=Desulfovibrio sp. JC010 TaxID=2593641 RepID=UPI0013D347C1|nr:helix-turn-helix transcriptional regulator [Desulfovibrio sp. JC010]NDV25956.1 helix-turn-helix transcriptional regulator [Desulfovibrio sp. JC010]
MTSITTKLGKRIKELRKQSNLTQDSLAEKAGLSGKHIGEIERGEVNVTAQSLEKVATALGIELPELMRCDHEGDVADLRAELIRHIENCPEEEVKLAYRLIKALR